MHVLVNIIGKKKYKESSLVKEISNLATKILHVHPVWKGVTTTCMHVRS
jgi:hypothetical protein